MLPAQSHSSRHQASLQLPASLQVQVALWTAAAVPQSSKGLQLSPPRTAWLEETTKVSVSAFEPVGSQGRAVTDCKTAKVQGRLAGRAGGV